MYHEGQSAACRHFRRYAGVELGSQVKQCEEEGVASGILQDSKGGYQVTAVCSVVTNVLIWPLHEFRLAEVRQFESGEGSGCLLLRRSTCGFPYQPTFHKLTPAYHHSYLVETSFEDSSSRHVEKVLTKTGKWKLEAHDEEDDLNTFCDAACPTAESAFCATNVHTMHQISLETWVTCSAATAPPCTSTQVG